MRCEIRSILHTVAKQTREENPARTFQEIIYCSCQFLVMFCIISLTKDWRQWISSLAALLRHICCAIVVCKSFFEFQRCKMGIHREQYRKSCIYIKSNGKAYLMISFSNTIYFLSYMYMMILQKLFFLSVFAKVENLCLSPGQAFAKFCQTKQIFA